MKIGDKVYIRGTIDEIRKDVVIIKNKGGYFGTVKEEIETDIGNYSDKLWKLSRNRALDEAIEAEIDAFKDIPGVPYWVEAIVLDAIEKLKGEKDASKQTTIQSD